MNKILHFIVHIMGWNCGSVISAYDEKKNLWVAFKCSTCGKISGAHIAKGIKNNAF